MPLASRVLHPLESPLLARAGFSHGFFTREGGVSRDAYATLSFSVAAGDDPAAVRENRARAAEALGVPERGLLYVSQVHGTDVAELDASLDPEAALERIADATLSRDERVACGVRTADCVPILLGDPRTGWAAAVHSGWRGTVAGAAAAALRALAERGVRAGDLVAAVGPHIEACCFEVGEDVATALEASSSAGASAVSREDGARPRVDLRAIVRAQLEGAGLDAGAIDQVRGCTVCDAGRFFSFRRDGQKSGRLLSAIRPRGQARGAIR